MQSLVNGQCAHRWRGMDRCLDLATTTRPIEAGEIIYDVPLCPAHASDFERERKHLPCSTR
jgi:hypothetical protein